MNDQKSTGKPGEDTKKADTTSDSPIDQGQGGQTQAANDPRNQPVASGGEATGDGPKSPEGSASSQGDAPQTAETDGGAGKPNPSDDLRRS